MILRILMLNYEFPPIGGGAANAHLALLKEYAQNDRLKIDVLTSAPKPGFFEEKFADNITIYKVGLHKKQLHYWRKIEVIEWLIKAGRRYRKLLSQNNYDLVHSFFAFPSGYLCYKTADKLPFIISLRGSDVPGYNIRLGLDYKLLAGLFRRIWSSAGAVIANSSGLRQLGLEFMPGLNIKVIPNGIDAGRFYPDDSKTLSKPPKLLTVCRLITRKRIDLLIQSLVRLKSVGMDAELNIVGDGNLMSVLKSLVEQLGLTGRVNFFGRVEPEKMPDIYRQNDIFVMASQHEGMSNAMLEAMASGLPIITTKCEGVEELIDDNGIIVEKAEPKAIARAIQTIAADKTLYEKMSTAARKKAENFTWKKVAERYVEIYELIAQGNNR